MSILVYAPGKDSETLLVCLRTVRGVTPPNRRLPAGFLHTWQPFLTTASFAQSSILETLCSLMYRPSQPHLCEAH